MKAAYAPLTFSWRGNHSGGWPVGVVVAMPRKPLEVVWRAPERVTGAAQGGFDLDSTLAAFSQRIEEMDGSKAGDPAGRIEALSSAWGFGTVQIGEAVKIEGDGLEIVDLCLAEAGL